MDPFTTAKNLGILTEYVDGQGHRHVTDEAVLKIILKALPERSPYRFLQGPVVIRSGRPAPTELTQAAALPLRWKVVAGPRTVAEGETRQPAIVWPQGLPEGAYRLHLTDAASMQEEAPLIVAPPRAFGGDFDRVG